MPKNRQARKPSLNRLLRWNSTQVEVLLIQSGFLEAQSDMPPLLVGRRQVRLTESSQITPTYLTRLKAEGFTFFEVKPAMRSLDSKKHRLVAFYNTPDLETRLREHVAEFFFP